MIFSRLKATCNICSGELAAYFPIQRTGSVPFKESPLDELMDFRNQFSDFLSYSASTVPLWKMRILGNQCTGQILFPSLVKGKHNSLIQKNLLFSFPQILNRLKPEYWGFKHRVLLENWGIHWNHNIWCEYVYLQETVALFYGMLSMVDVITGTDGDESDPMIRNYFSDISQRLTGTLQSLNTVLLPCKGSSSMKSGPLS